MYSLEKEKPFARATRIKRGAQRTSNKVVGHSKSSPEALRAGDAFFPPSPHSKLHVLGSRFSALSSKLQVLRSRFGVPDTELQAPTSKHRVLAFRALRSTSRVQRPLICTPGTLVDAFRPACGVCCSFDSRYLLPPQIGHYVALNIMAVM